MSYVVLEFLCPDHGRFDSLELRSSAPDTKPCACGQLAELVISAPGLRIPIASVTTGKISAAPPGAFDTRAIADGMPTGEFKRMRTKQRAARRRDQLRKMIA